MPPTVYIVPGPGELVAELREIKELALNARRSWIDKHTGEEQSYSMPDYKAAISAIRVQAEICGLIRNKPEWDTEELVVDAVRRSLGDPKLRALVLRELRKAEPKLVLSSGDPES